jgi:two-component system sensor histidine kinase DegS
LIARPIPYGQEYEALAELQICHANGTPCPPSDLPLTRSALHGERFENEEMQVIWPDGQRRSWLVNSSPILSPSGEIEGAVSIFQDTTEMRKAAELIQNNAAQIEIQRYLSRAREQERLTIAHDLHDGPLQEMIGLSFTLNETVTARSADETQQYLDNMQTHLQELIRGMRSFCNELRPPTLTPFGLERAIRSHADSFQKAHPEIHIRPELVHDGQLLPDTVRITLFQVYRESLNNILKHAQATEVIVRLSLEQETVVLEIQDNGKGFEIPYHWVEFARQGHLGLVGMQERAEAVGGHVRLVSRPGEGTAVIVSVPLQERSELLPQ